MLSVTKRISAGPVPLNRVDVAVYTNSKHCPGSRARPSQAGLYTTDEQIYDKPNGLGIEGDVESCGEK